MPRQPRLDAPETLHHVMVRGIERTAIFRDDADRTVFVTRLAALVPATWMILYTSALPPNHLRLRCGTLPSSASCVHFQLQKPAA